MEQGPSQRETAFLLVLIVFIDSKTSHVYWTLCLLILSRYQLHLHYAIMRMSILYLFIAVWDLPPDTLLLTPSSSFYFNKHLPRACCVCHPSVNRNLLRYHWWCLTVCKKNHTWLIKPHDLFPGCCAWHWARFHQMLATDSDNFLSLHFLLPPTLSPPSSHTGCLMLNLLHTFMMTLSLLCDSAYLPPSKF